MGPGLVPCGPALGHELLQGGVDLDPKSPDSPASQTANRVSPRSSGCREPSSTTSARWACGRRPARLRSPRTRAAGPTTITPRSFKSSWRSRDASAGHGRGPRLCVMLTCQDLPATRPAGLPRRAVRADLSWPYAMSDRFLRCAGGGPGDEGPGIQPMPAPPGACEHWRGHLA